MRLDRYLAKCGFGSRSITRKLIKEGRVTVDGTPCLNQNMHIEEEVIQVDGEVLEYRAFVYLMLNKPKGVVSARVDKEHKTVLDLIVGYDQYELSPVGRLDIDTTGLLLLTNNGKLAHALIHPTKEKEKIYYVQHEHPLSSSDVEALINGIELKDFTTKQAKYERIDDYSCYLTITEGKYHQVKRMFQNRSNQVMELKRVAFAGLLLDESLELGDYRELTANEIEALKNQL